MLRAGRISGEIRQVDLSLICGRELLLGLLGSLSDSLQGKLVGLDVHAVLRLELLNKELLHDKVKVLTAQRRVTIGCLDLEHTSRDFENGDVEGSSSEIINGEDFTVSLVQTEGESGSSRLIDDSLDLKVGDLASVLGSLSLGVIEVSRHSDDSFLADTAQVALSGLFHLHQRKRANLLRGVLLAPSLDPGITVAGASNLIR